MIVSIVNFQSRALPVWHSDPGNIPSKPLASSATPVALIIVLSFHAYRLLFNHLCEVVSLLATKQLPPPPHLYPFWDIIILYSVSQHSVRSMVCRLIFYLT